uniref:Venom S1 protease with CUB domain 7 n=1 Tax=Lethocerus distinctifemur TaxID=280095 RepID=A0A2K8JRM2_9HEMI|nr:venom S1 protease with CUB domain 7 [Lethocerus distinctifemur]
MKKFYEYFGILLILALYLEQGYGQDNEENGTLDLNYDWIIPRAGIEVQVQSAGYPRQAAGNTLQTWTIRTNPGNSIKLICYEIRLTQLQGGLCSTYVFRVNDRHTFKDYCGSHYGMTRVSKQNILVLTFKTGVYDSGYVNCTVQAIPKGSENDSDSPSTTTEPPLAVGSLEIDSSEHGGPMGPKSTNCSCGWANKEIKKVIGGKETAINEFPFNVALKDAGQRFPFCGGSIITPYHVLTCAHCVYKRKSQRITVTVGDHDWTKDNETNYTKSIDVIHMELHSGYAGNEPNFDIAILVLLEKIEFNRFVGPACLPNRQLHLEGEQVKVIGWGRTTPYGFGSPFLKKVNVRVIPLRECARSFPSHVNLTDPHLLCTYSKMKGIGLGDSGGPVVWLDPETNRYTVVGLPALVQLYPGDYHFSPDMSTDVSSYLGWIARVVDLTVPTASTCKKL